MKNMRRTGEFNNWLKNLRDYRAKTRILTRIKRLAEGNPGDNRFLGEISELRINYGPGYRVYYKDTGKESLSCFAAATKPPSRRI
jgi:putative addiction module killer protein